MFIHYMHTPLCVQRKKYGLSTQTTNEYGASLVHTIIHFTRKGSKVARMVNHRMFYVELSNFLGSLLWK